MMKQRRKGCRVRGIGSRNGERNERKESVKKGGLWPQRGQRVKRGDVMVMVMVIESEGIGRGSGLGQGE